MQIARKHLLGLGCLAIVGAITAFACTLPTGAVSTGGDAEIMVEVYPSGAETVIHNPEDGEIFSNPSITFSETHAHAKSVKYYIKRLNSDGSIAWSREITDQRIEGPDESGTSTFTLNMDDYGGAGVFIFQSDLIAINDIPMSDSVRFTYAEIEAEDPVSTGSSIKYRVDYTAGVKSLTYQMFDSSNNPVTSPVNVNTPEPTTGGYMDIEIDVSSLGLASGRYQILTTGFSGENGTGIVIGSSLVSFDYTADAPDIPDTGSLFASLNISRADYLLTGVIGFTAISIAALFIVLKSKKRE